MMVSTRKGGIGLQAWSLQASEREKEEAQPTLASAWVQVHQFQDSSASSPVSKEHGDSGTGHSISQLEVG